MCLHVLDFFTAHIADYVHLVSGQDAKNTFSEKEAKGAGQLNDDDFGSMCFGKEFEVSNSTFMMACLYHELYPLPFRYSFI